MNQQNATVLLLTALFFIGGATALVQSHPISEIVVDTTDLVNNLNADLLDGHQGSYYKDTNAQTICPNGKVLDGSGNCVSSSSGSRFSNVNIYSDKAHCQGSGFTNPNYCYVSATASCNSDEFLVAWAKYVRHYDGAPEPDWYGTKKINEYQYAKKGPSAFDYGVNGKSGIALAEDKSELIGESVTATPPGEDMTIWVTAVAACKPLN